MGAGEKIGMKMERMSGPDIQTIHCERMGSVRIAKVLDMLFGKIIVDVLN